MLSVSFYLRILRAQCFIYRMDVSHVLKKFFLPAVDSKNETRQKYLTENRGFEGLTKQMTNGYRKFYAKDSC